MDAVRVAEAGITGAKGWVATPVTRWIAARVPVSERRLRALVGTVFLLAALKTLVGAIRTALRSR